MTQTYILRVWMPDRPGALGALASRIGAVGGDVTGIDILERGAGRAIDELVVELPDDALVELLVAEIHQVDGVDIESIRPVAEALHDPRVDALETAALLVGAPTPAAASSSCAAFRSGAMTRMTCAASISASARISARPCSRTAAGS